MVAKVKTGKKSTKGRSKAFVQAVLGKPSGVIQPRVQQAGPERFGIVSIDCAKDRSKWMLCDFYGRVLVPPSIVEHRRNELHMAVLALHKAVAAGGL